MTQFESEQRDSGHHEYLHRQRRVRARMIALDGNAIAGDVLEVLGVDLSAWRCACEACGTSSFFAEAVVYMHGPGRVARCRACGELLMVLVTIRGITCVDLSGIAGLQPEG